MDSLSKYVWQPEAMDAKYPTTESEACIMIVAAANLILRAVVCVDFLRGPNTCPDSDTTSVAFHVKRTASAVGHNRLALHEDLYYATCGKVREVIGEVERRLQNGFLKGTDIVHWWGEKFSYYAPVQASDFLAQMRHLYQGQLLKERLVLLLDIAVLEENARGLLQKPAGGVGLRGLEDQRLVPIPFIFAGLSEKYRPILAREQAQRLMEAEKNLAEAKSAAKDPEESGDIEDPEDDDTPLDEAQVQANRAAAYRALTANSRASCPEGAFPEVPDPSTTVPEVFNDSGLDTEFDADKEAPADERSSGRSGTMERPGCLGLGLATHESLGSIKPKCRLHTRGSLLRESPLDELIAEIETAAAATARGPQDIRRTMTGASRSSPTEGQGAMASGPCKPPQGFARPYADWYPRQYLTTGSGGDHPLPARCSAGFVSALDSDHEEVPEGKRKKKHGLPAAMEAAKRFLRRKS